MRVDFEFNVAETDTERRLIRGVGVPWNRPAKLGGRVYAFARGSLRPERARTPLLLGHDGEPVGVLAELTDEADGALVNFRVDATPEGDKALVQAASGSRGSLSIGADVDESTLQADGSVLVTAARYVHFALVPHGAFLGADVEHVVAEATHEPEGETMTDDAANKAPTDDTTDDGDDLAIAATRPRVRVLAERKPADLNAGEFVALVVRAQHGERDAREFLAAALTETISTDVSGLLPPTYEKTVMGGKETARPLYGTFKGKTLPGVGLMVNKPKWVTPPVGAWAATVDDDATTGKVTIGAQTADVQRWDWAGAIPWVVVQRSDPSIIDAIYGEAVQSFYGGVEAKIYAELSAAAPGVATSLGAAIAEFYTATGNKRSPDVIIMAPDVWGTFADASALTVAVAAGGVSGSELTTSFAGLAALTSGTLAPGETVLATRRAVDARITDPVRLTANAIGALNVELAVVGEGLFDTDYPGELLKFAAIVPPAGLAAARSK